MIHQDTGRIIALSVPDDVLSTTAPALRTRLTALLENQSPFEILEIDLRAARMVDSVGLNLLVWAWKSAKARGARLRIRIANPDIERTFRFTRLSHFVDVVKEYGPENER